MSTLPAPAAPTLDELRRRLSGDAFGPGDEGWDEARAAWNLAVDQRPDAVVLAESSDDVIAAVEHARAAGLRVTAQGTGHFAAVHGSLDGALLVKTERMRGIAIDAGCHRARVEAGVVWADLVEAAAGHGLAALAGSSPDVGVVGYTLGGGIGWLSRKHGLAAESVLAIELVTADGDLIRADRHHSPDLFWALRGGGGSFGVVTAVELRLFPVEDVYAGTLFWPIERAGEVLRRWRRWTRSAPESAVSSGRILQLPPIPEVPEPLRGRALVAVEVAYQGGDEEGAELLRPLRALGPEIDTVARIPAAALLSLHMDPPHPVPGMGDGMLLDGLTDEAVDALVAVAGVGSGSPLLSVELRQLGGALARRPAGAGVLGAIDGDFALFAVGVPTDAERAAAVGRHIAAVQTAMAPWRAATGYHNYTERRGDASEFFPELTYRRLRRVKARYDADDLVFGGHPVPPLDDH